MRQLSRLLVRLPQPDQRNVHLFWTQLKTPIQVEWLDYWFKPKVAIVTFPNYLQKIVDLQNSGATILSVTVNKGTYSIEYKPNNETKVITKDCRR